MNKKTTWILTIIILGVLVVAGAINLMHSSNNTNAQVKIVIVMPFSGELAVFGNNVKHGVEIALKQNRLSSSTVELITEDTAGFTTNGALSAWRRAIEQDHADIVIGPFGPAQTLTIAPTISSSTKVTVISISNCDDRFKNYPEIFCVYPGIRDQVEHAINFMKSKGWKRVYLMTENTEFGLLVESILKEHASDISLIGSEKIVPNQSKDFRTNIAKVIAEQPDVVYAAFAPNEGFITLKQYPNLSKGIPLYIGTDVNKGQLKDMFGSEAKNIYFAALLGDSYEPTFTKEFLESYETDPDQFAALGNSAAEIIFKVLKDSGMKD
ncbi:MAG: ABC transporter substrate-binding protein, partial [bacterium]